jgi:hypothetical protein
LLATTESALGDVAGAADRMGQTLGDNAKTKLTAFKRTVEQGLVTALGTVLDKLQEFAKDPEIQAWWADLQARLRTIADEWMPKFQAGWDAVVKAFKENKEEITLVIGAVATALAFLVEHGFGSLARSIQIFGAIVRHGITVKNAIVAVADGIGRRWDQLMAFFKAIPTALRALGNGIAIALTSPFKTAFNAIAIAWNHTVGKLSFSVPSWVPGIGGRGWSVPDIPMLGDGAVVRARPGGVLALLAEGGQDEAVVPLPRGVANAGAGQAGGALRLDPRSAGSGLEKMFLSWLQQALRESGLALVAAS